MSKALIIVIVVVVAIGSLGGAYWYVEDNEGDGVIEENNPPQALITSPTAGQKILKTEKITFDGSLSSDEDGDDLTFEWTSSMENFLSNEIYFEMKLTNVGVHIITLMVKDTSDEQGTAQVTIEVIGEDQENTPPIAVIDNPIDGEKYLTTDSIDFDGTSSSDIDDDIVTYKWTSSLSGVLEENDDIFSSVLEKGEHEITLEVIDSYGEKSEDLVTIEVQEAGKNNAPQLSDGKVDPESGTVDDDFTFSVNYKDEDNDNPSKIIVKIDNTDYNMVKHSGNDYKVGVIYKYEITGESLGEGNHEFKFGANDGIADAKGDINNHQGPEVVEKSDLGANITANNTARVGDNITFDGSNSYGEIVSWNWSFGDGNHSDDENETNHIYDKSDNYTVILIVKDDLEKEDSVEHVINIKNQDYDDGSNYNVGPFPNPPEDSHQFPVLSGTSIPLINATWTADRNGIGGGEIRLTVWITNEDGNEIFTDNLTLADGQNSIETNTEFHAFESYGENWEMHVRWDSGSGTNWVTGTMNAKVTY